MFFNIVFLLEILNILINNFAVYSFRLQQMIQIDNEHIGRSNVGQVSNLLYIEQPSCQNYDKFLYFSKDLNISIL